MGARTQSKAFASAAQTSGHASGVIVASSARTASASAVSSASRTAPGCASERAERGSVGSEQASQEDATDLKEPVCGDVAARLSDAASG